jgi:two-component system chemotaxis response regulator CheB
MYSLPPNLDSASEPRLTGITCPDCAGAMEVQREGHGNLRFICRVKHAMSVDELLTGKEEKIEGNLWACVRELEELATVLQDLERYARQHGRHQTGGPHGDRIVQAREHVRRLRELIEETRPVDLTRAGDEGAEGGGARVPAGGR